MNRCLPEVVLEPGATRTEDLVALMVRVENAREMHLDASKEAGLLRRGGHRYAVTSAGDVVAYLSARVGWTPSSGDNAPIVSAPANWAFIAVLAVDPSRRREHFGVAAVREFGRRVAKLGVTHVGLHLDETPPITNRRDAFVAMGFTFPASSSLFGYAGVPNLLQH